MSIDFSDTGFETQEPLVTTSLTRDDENEGSLRPKTLREYIGQEKAKGNLEVFIQAAKMRHEPLDHVLLHGPPGLGKTTLSGIIAAKTSIVLGTILQCVGVTIGYALLTYFAFTNAIGSVNFTLLIAYQCFWALVVMLLPNLRRY